MQLGVVADLSDDETVLEARPIRLRAQLERRGRPSPRAGRRPAARGSRRGRPGSAWAAEVLGPVAGLPRDRQHLGEVEDLEEEVERVEDEAERLVEAGDVREDPIRQVVGRAGLLRRLAGSIGPRAPDPARGSGRPRGCGERTFTKVLLGQGSRSASGRGPTRGPRNVDSDLLGPLVGRVEDRGRRGGGARRELLREERGLGVGGASSRPSQPFGRARARSRSSSGRPRIGPVGVRPRPTSPVAARRRSFRPRLG